MWLWKIGRKYGGDPGGRRISFGVELEQTSLFSI
jgi:hypothetical protein